MSETIATNKTCIFNDELKNENGETLDSSQGYFAPYPYGHGNIISDVEEHGSQRNQRPISSSCSLRKR